MSFKIDPSGNIDNRDYLYSATGQLMKKDRSYQIDPSGNIKTSDYTINTRERRFNKNDNSVQDEPDKIKCGDYESDKKNPTTGKKIKIGQNFYTVNNGILSNDKISIDSNSIVKMNSNQYIYNIAQNDLYGNLGTNKEFYIPYNRLTEIFLGKNGNAIYNYNGLGSIIYRVYQIVLQKPYSANATTYPLHISSIRFYDYQNQLIPPNSYDVILSNIADGQFNSSSSATSIDKYYNTGYNRSSSYGGPRVDSYSLYLNKTTSYNSSGVPQIDIDRPFPPPPALPVPESIPQSTINRTNLYAQGQILSGSFGYIGHGFATAAYTDLRTRPPIPAPPASGAPSPVWSQSYTFKFKELPFIKYVEIENRKDAFTDVSLVVNNVRIIRVGYDRIIGASIDTYINIGDRPINTPPPFDSRYRIQCQRGVNVNSSLTSNTFTKTQPRGRVERYTTVNYGNTQPTNRDQYDPIVRYYVQ